MYKVSWIFAVAYAVLSLYLKVCPVSHVLLPFEFGVHLFMLNSLLILILLACLHPYDIMSSLSALHVFIVLETTATARICDIMLRRDYMTIDNLNIIVSFAIQLGIYNSIFVSEAMYKLWSRAPQVLANDEEDTHEVKLMPV